MAAFTLKNIKRDTLYVIMDGASEDVITNSTANTIISLNGTIHNAWTDAADIVIEIVNDPGGTPTTIRKFLQTLNANESLVIQPPDAVCIQNNQKITVSVDNWVSGMADDIHCHFDVITES